MMNDLESEFDHPVAKMLSELQPNNVGDFESQIIFMAGKAEANHQYRARAQYRILGFTAAMLLVAATSAAITWDRVMKTSRSDLVAGHDTPTEVVADSEPLLAIERGHVNRSQRSHDDLLDHLLSLHLSDDMQVSNGNRVDRAVTPTNFRPSQPTTLIELQREWTSGINL